MKIKKLNKDKLKDIGFKYDKRCSDKDSDCYSYRFVVDKYNNIPILWCVIKIWIDDFEYRIDVVNNNGDQYHHFYLPTPGSSEYIEKIRKRIKKEFVKLGLLKKGRKK